MAIPSSDGHSPVLAGLGPPALIYRLVNLACSLVYFSQSASRRHPRGHGARPPLLSPHAHPHHLHLGGGHRQCPVQPAVAAVGAAVAAETPPARDHLTQQSPSVPLCTRPCSRRWDLRWSAAQAPCGATKESSPLFSWY